MSSPAILRTELLRPRSAVWFGAAALLLMVSAATLSAAVPLQFSIATVFLFAGPHNWIEARYFLARTPARWGKLGAYFVVGLGGVAVLTAALATLTVFTGLGPGYYTTSTIALASRHAMFILWMLTLILMRSRQHPRRDWLWTVPVALAVLALAVLYPYQASMMLVYAHPLMAFWILDRELRLRRPEWRRAFHICLACLPIFIGFLWWMLASAPPLPGESENDLAIRIVRHAGAGTIPGVSAHLLVALHTFLEMLHYSIWLVAIPLIGLRSSPWKLKGVPLANRSIAWKRAIITLLAGSAGVVVILWVCFLAAYPVTRDVYFTVATLHVLAEVPFLLRML